MKNIRFTITLMYTGDDHNEHLVSGRAEGETVETASKDAEAELGKLTRFLKLQSEIEKNTIKDGKD